jgi:hypothetical protein
MLSIYLGYLASGLLSTYLDPRSYALIADTIGYGIFPVIINGVPYAILIYVLSFWLSPRILNPKYMMPSLALLIFVVGMWLNNDVSLNKGNFRDLYIADVGILMFGIIYALTVYQITSKKR